MKEVGDEKRRELDKLKRQKASIDEEEAKLKQVGTSCYAIKYNSCVTGFGAVGERISQKGYRSARRYCGSSHRKVKRGRRAAPSYHEPGRGLLTLSLTPTSERSALDR